MAGWTFAFCLVALGTFVSADTVVYPESYNGAGSRIVSGWEAAPGQFPFQLSLRMVNDNGGVTACGASIIHEEWGMTAAHCTALRTTIVIRAGTVNLTRPSVIFETTEYYNHPSYIDAMQSIVQPNDIALIKFPIKLKFNELIQPIRLQRDEHKNLNYDGVRMEAAGWGRTWTQGTSPENMNWVYLLGNSNWICRLAFNFSPIIVDSTICASGYNVTSQSTCQGDSGGTLTVYEEDGIRTLVGVTSFVSGSGCHTNVPAGFIRPGHYHDWYRQVTGIDFDWEPVAEESSEEEAVSTPAPEESSEEDAATTPAPEESSEEVQVTKAPEESSEEANVTAPSAEVSSEESSESSSNSSEPSSSSSSESSSNSSESSSSSSSESSSNSSESSSSSSSESSSNSSESSSSSSSESSSSSSSESDSNE